MSKKLIAILVLAFVVGITAAAFAEVQNVKVSGELSIVPFSRNNMDLGNADAAKYVTGTASFTKVKISANLTDNVDAIVGFANERVWTTLNSGVDNNPTNDNVYLDVAYVSLKDFLKESTGVPLTMVLGRQPIRLGSGLLVGAPVTNQFESSGPLSYSSICDFSIKKSFDAIVGVLDYNPLTITLGYVKGTYGAGPYDKNDDINVWAAVAAYNFGEDFKNLVGELTFVQQSVITEDNVNNVGVRFTAMPVKDLGMEVEYVYQRAKEFGVFDMNLSGDLDEGKSRASDAFRINGTFAMPDVTWTPSIGLDYTRLSKYWNVMHEDMTPASIMNLIFPNQNVSVIGLTATAKPMNDMMLKLRYANANLAKKYDGAWVFTSAGTGGDYAMTGKKALGWEVDAGVTYDYTADVKFGLDYGYFKPGKGFDKDINKEAANQLIGSMKVTF